MEIGGISQFINTDKELETVRSIAPEDVLGPDDLNGNRSEGFLSEKSLTYLQEEPGIPEQDAGDFLPIYDYILCWRR